MDGPASLTPPRKGLVHLWRLDLSGGRAASCEADPCERDLPRARRFAFDRDRDRFLRARCALRSVLGAYLGVSPREVGLATGANGKPRLEREAGLEFNLSHSGDHGLLAVTRDARVGVDIEELRPRDDVLPLAERLFTRAERLSLCPAQSDPLARQFLTCWTRKEAYLKALGTGLTVEPRGVEVGTGAQRVRVAIAGEAEGRFVEVATVDAGERCVGALAVEGGFEHLESREWDCPAARVCRGAGQGAGGDGP